MRIDPLLKIVPNKFIIFPLIEVGGLLKMAALSNLAIRCLLPFSVCLLLSLWPHGVALLPTLEG